MTDHRLLFDSLSALLLLGTGYLGEHGLDVSGSGKVQQS